MCALCAALYCNSVSLPPACAAASLAPARARESEAGEIAPCPGPCPAGRATDAARATSTRLTVGTWRMVATGQVAGVRDAPVAAHSALPLTMIAIVLFRGMRDRAN